MCRIQKRLLCPLSVTWVSRKRTQLLRKLSHNNRNATCVPTWHQVHKHKNPLNREFRTDKSNSKLVTDISYIHTKQGVLYLSMIRGLYDNSIISYKPGTQ